MGMCARVAAAGLAVVLLSGIGAPAAFAEDTSVNFTVSAANSSASTSVDFLSVVRIGDTDRFTITAKVKGTGTLTITIDGVTYASRPINSGSTVQEYSFEVRLAPGTHIVDFSATDGMSTSTQSTTVRVDALPTPTASPLPAGSQTSGGSTTTLGGVLVVAHGGSGSGGGGDSSGSDSSGAVAAAAAPGAAAMPNTGDKGRSNSGSSDSEPTAKSTDSSLSDALDRARALKVGLGAVAVTLLLAALLYFFWLILARRRRREDDEEEEAHRLGGFGVA